MTEAETEAPDCMAELHIGDDFGDNVATMHCHLKLLHDGKHREVFRLNDEKGARSVTIEWEGDDRDKVEEDPALSSPLCVHFNDPAICDRVCIDCGIDCSAHQEEGCGQYQDEDAP